ncbi:glutathione S-transferase family protein [Aureimonas sp. Leaf324]|jgi:glutathione S-transferase|uniref:glutathione S-transferase family protein n=1 Tax=Aureimonas sp. Leaf324 TaxID=1736336 RepID=UPI0006F3A2E6|nr:glutathione S-transferase family protein [Aureimonas sp. Leaf324]KQQ79526.1 glutathione S-transferase [Aureimonas sp. Leaf324]
MDAEAFRRGPIRITAYDWVPRFAEGHVRDLRLRWALEEAGLPYEVDLVAQGAQRGPANLQRQPFGQVPAMTVGGQTLFETGACVWRIAETSDALLPADEAERDACLSWTFAALDTIEKPIAMMAMLRFFTKDKAAAAAVEPDVSALLAERLGRLAGTLGDAPFLVGERFTVADLMMTAVLRDAEEVDLQAFPSLIAYVARHEARPAFQAALDAQLVPFRENAARYRRPRSGAIDRLG